MVLKKGNHLKITKIQKEILIGLLLGDAHLERSLNGLSYCLKIEQNILKKTYIDHLYKIFDKWCILSGPEVKGDYIYFQSQFSISLLFYGRTFYNDEGNKKIPKLIHRWLTPRAIAYWYMDKGGLKSKDSKVVFFNTQGFTFKEVSLLSDILNKKYNLITIVQKQKVGYYIYVSEHSYEILRSLIFPYIIEFLWYKFPVLNEINKRA